MSEPDNRLGGSAAFALGQANDRWRRLAVVAVAALAAGLVLELGRARLRPGNVGALALALAMPLAPPILVGSHAVAAGFTVLSIVLAGALVAWHDERVALPRGWERLLGAGGVCAVLFMLLAFAFTMAGLFVGPRLLGRPGSDDRHVFAGFCAAALTAVELGVAARRWSRRRAATPPPPPPSA